MRIRKRLLAAAAAALVGALGGGGVAGGPAGAQPVHLDEGHVDVLHVSYTGGSLVVQVLDDTGSAPVSRDPAEVTFGVKPAAMVNLGSVSWTDCLGGQMWVLPHVPTSGLLYPGWSTSAIGIGVFVSNTLTFAITDIDNSAANGGHVTLYRPSQRRVLLDSDGCDGAVSEPVPVNTHDHPAWAFSEAGSYEVTFEVTGNLVGGGSASSGPVTYTFIVD